MRPIEALKSPVIGPANLGPVPELRWVAIADMVIDDEYQRPLGAEKHILDIAQNWSWLKYSPVVLSPVDGGKFAIVDGQRRSTAAACIDIEALPSLVSAADRVRQAAAFHAINGNVTRMTRLALWKAANASGDCAARAIMSACDEAGVTIIAQGARSKNIQPRQTMAVGTIGECVAVYGRELTVLTLRALCAADKGGALLAVIIKAAIDALQDHAEWRADEARLLAAFAGLDIPALHKGAFAASQERGRLIDCLYAEFVCALERCDLGAAEAAE